MQQLKDHETITVLLPKVIIEALNRERDQINALPHIAKITRIKLIRNILANHYKILFTISKHKI